MVRKNNIVLYMDTDIWIERDNIDKDIGEDVKTKFDTSNYELDRPLARGKSKKVTGLMKDELSGKIMAKLLGLRAKTYSYLIDDSSEDKKSKRYK